MDHPKARVSPCRRAAEYAGVAGADRAIETDTTASERSIDSPAFGDVGC
jgi:hypothetical protein